MTNYVIVIDDGIRPVERHGLTLEDRGAAGKEAIRIFGSVIKDEPDSFVESNNWRLSVQDQFGHALFELHATFKDCTKP